VRDRTRLLKVCAHQRLGYMYSRQRDKSLPKNKSKSSSQEGQRRPARKQANTHRKSTNRWKSFFWSEATQYSKSQIQRKVKARKAKSKKANRTPFSRVSKKRIVGHVNAWKQDGTCRHTIIRLRPKPKKQPASKASNHSWPP